MPCIWRLLVITTSIFCLDPTYFLLASCRSSCLLLTEATVISVKCKSFAQTLLPVALGGRLPLTWPCVLWVSPAHVLGLLLAPCPELLPTSSSLRVPGFALDALCLDCISALHSLPASQLHFLQLKCHFLREALPDLPDLFS